MEHAPDQVACEAAAEHGGVPRSVGRVARRGRETVLLHDDGLILRGHDRGVVVDPLASPCHVIGRLAPAVL